MAQVGSPVVNQLGGAGGSSLALNKTGVTAGNTLLIQLSYGVGSNSAPTIADSSGQTWTKDKTSGIVGSFNSGADIWRLTNANAGTHNITVTLPASSYAVGTLEEWAGLLTPSTPLDQVGTNNSTTNTTSGNSGTTPTTTQASELLVAAICVNPPVGVANDGLTTPSGWTNQQLYTTTTTTVGASHITKDVSSTGAQSASWTWTETSQYAAVIATYKYAAGTATDVNCTLGAATIAGQTATVQLATAVNGTVGAATIAGPSATVQLATAVNCTLGSISAAGASASIQTGTSVNCTVGSVTIAGQAATVQTATTVACALGTALIDGQPALVQSGTSINCTLAAVAIAGLSAAVALATTVACTLGTVSAAGQQCAVQVGTGVSVVSVTANKQFWQSGTDWTAKTVSVTQAGDAILTFGLFYAAGTLGQKYPPVDNAGTFVQGVDPGRPDPGSYPGYPQPVTSCIYYQLNAPTGTHTITPPNIGPSSTDDGNMWSVVLRGMPLSGSPRATGHSHQVSNSAGTTFSSVSVALSSACQIGDIVFAILGYDDDRTFGTVTFTEPTGWTRIAVDTDAVTSCPCGVYWKIATAADVQTVSLAWNDPHGTVTDASIIAFAPLPPTITCTTGTLSASGQTANVQLATAVNAALGTVGAAGQSANVQLATAVNCTLGTVATSGLPANVQLATAISATLGQVGIVGLPASVPNATTIPAAVGAILSSGLPASVQTVTSINASSASVFAIGLPANIRLDVNVGCTLATMTGAGLTASINSSGTSQNALPSHIYKGSPRSRVYVGLPE